MNLHQLKALDALEQAGSFSGADHCLDLTQPAVSIQLKKLQAHYGVKLFWRCGRSLEFSAFGFEYLNPVQAFFDGVRETQPLHQQRSSEAPVNAGRRQPIAFKPPSPVSAGRFVSTNTM
ncbi:MAG: LysR family transcriptional regulator [Desulfosarcina sp.]|nr:LysR family transcriptional regulator [Desulfosarcina sp.]